MTNHHLSSDVVRQLDDGISDPQIRKELVEHHSFDPHSAYRFVEDVKEANPEIARRREQQISAVVYEAGRAERKATARQFIIRRARMVSIGLAVFGLGLLIVQAVGVGLLPLGGYMLAILPIVTGPFIIVEGIID